MLSAYRVLFDHVVLKPLFFFSLIPTGLSFYHGAWLIAGAFLFTIFATIFIGTSLHHNSSYQELAEGVPAFANGPLLVDPEEVTVTDTSAVTRACFRVAFLVGLIAFTFAIRTQSWIFSLLLGAGVWLLGGIFVLAIFGLIARQYMVGRLRTIAPGSFCFWLATCVTGFGAFYLVTQWGGT